MCILLHLTTQVVLQTRCQYRHLRILTQRVVRCRTPYHIDVRIQLVKELVNLLQLTHKDRMLLAGIDIKQDALRLANVVAIEQWRVQRVQDSLLHTMLTTGPTHRHNGTTTVLHRCFYIFEVTLDAPIAGQRNQFCDALHCIHQYVVCPLECLLHRELRVRIDVAQPLVVHYQQRVYVLAHLVHTLQRLDNLLFLLKVERYRHHTHCQQSHLLGDACHQRSSTSTSATTHACCHEHHLRAIAQQLPDILEALLALALSLFRIATSAKAST